MTNFPQIPEQWLSLLIGEVADVVAGGTPKASDPDNFAEPGTQIAWLTPADLSKYAKKYISHGARDLSAQGYGKSSAKLMAAGTILFSSRAPIGYVAVAANEISTNQGFKNFVLPAVIDPSYAYYFLRSIRDIAESMGTGTTFKEISGTNAKKLPFTLAPLAEQKVIAEKLDTLLAQVENTKARLERIPKILKRFRQSVLAAAVSGRLTEEWSSRELELREIIEFQNGYAFKSSWFENSGTHQVVKLGNIRDGYLALENSPAYVGEGLASEFSRYTPSVGDILISMTGTRFKRDYGFGCVVKGEKNLLINQRVGRVIPDSSKVNPDFLSLFIRSDVFRDQFFEGETGGVNQGNVGSKHILSILAELPTVNVQEEIVRRVDQLFAHANRIEQQVNNALDRVNNLTQSILANAFRGELTEQWRRDNPELISSENSAEALLERIKAEKAESKPAKKARKQTTA